MQQKNFQILQFLFYMFDRILILLCSQKYLGARYLMTMEIDELTEENPMPTNLVSKINRQFQDLII